MREFSLNNIEQKLSNLTIEELLEHLRLLSEEIQKELNKIALQVNKMSLYKDLKNFNFVL